MSKLSNLKIKWPKSVEKFENESRLGPLRQNLPPPPSHKKTVRWIHQCPYPTYHSIAARSTYIYS